jgi:hypothetical protein
VPIELQIVPPDAAQSSPRQDGGRASGDSERAGIGEHAAQVGDLVAGIAHAGRCK